MGTRVTSMMGIDEPIFVFSPFAEVVAAVSRAGGMGVLGCVGFEDLGLLDETLTWIDENTNGKPYGVDIVIPQSRPADLAEVDFDSFIPQQHRDFVSKTMAELGVCEPRVQRAGVTGWLHSVAKSQFDVASKHRISLVANALGSPPPELIERAHELGVQVAALAGTARHAVSHVEAGVDIVVAQGGEAGGHTGKIGTMVLVPDVVRAVGEDALVLAAGGIATGRQVAAARLLGADGVWMGTRWLATVEADPNSKFPSVQQALLGAGSDETVRTRIYSGKPARILKNRWTRAWEQDGAPEPLPMPLQNMLVGAAHDALTRSGDPSVVPIPAGQVVGLIDDVPRCEALFTEIVTEARTSIAGLAATFHTEGDDVRVQ